MRLSITMNCAVLLVALLLHGCGNLLGDIGEKNMGQPDPAKSEKERANR